MKATIQNGKLIIEIDMQTPGNIARLEDAKVMAAAPELLAALKAVASMVEAYHEVPPDRARQVRAAIAKAEETSPSREWKLLCGCSSDADGKRFWCPTHNGDHLGNFIHKSEAE